MREENGESTLNARIKIDYSKKKPKVSFSYPSKDHQVQGSMFFYIILFWMIVFYLLFICIPPLYLGGSSMDAILLKEGKQENSYNLSNYEEFVIFYEENNMLNKTFLEYNESSLIEFYEKLKYPLGFFLLWFLVSCLTYFPFKKQWKRIYPKFQGWRQSKKLTKLDKRDIKKENKLYYVELPVFNNIVLDYKATEDFSKYLCLFEIKEHKFKYYLLGRGKLNKLKEKHRRRELKERKKRELNEWIWYARFYFNKKPEKGYIEIIYK